MSNGGDVTLRFPGAMALDEGRRARVATFIRFNRWDPTVLDVTLLWDENEQDRRAASSRVRNPSTNHLWIHSLSPQQSSVEILGISKTTVSDSEASFGVAAIQVGITQDSILEGRAVRVIARLQPSGILMLPSIHDLHFSGTVRVERIEDGIASVDSSLGVLEARETYEYSESVEHGNKATHRIQRASIMGTIRLEANVSLYDAHEALKRQLDEICAALSLCYRQSVDYYEIEYIAVDNPQPTRRALFRRRWSSARCKAQNDELIHMRELTNGGLQRLVVSIRSSVHCKALTRAIGFLAGSYEARLETAYFMAYSATETIVNACADVAKGRRPSFESRIEAACQKWSPKTLDLWPGMSFVKGIKRAAALRNSLFHEALASAGNSMYGDLVRIRTFAERLMLKSLGWPDDRIWTWYDQELKRINSSS